MKLDNNLDITQSYLYNAYGDVYKSQDFTKEHSSWLGKTKDMESNLNDHGVRKYDGFAHRFTAPDVMWEKYIGWNVYQYSLNNPICLIDNNGKWVAELSNESHAHTNYVQRNNNGYIANKINNVFYEKWKETAPAIADFVQNKSFFVMQKSLSLQDYGVAIQGGNKMWVDLLKPNAENNLERTAVHEIAHLMGKGEFGAFSVNVALGQFSLEELTAGLTKKDMTLDEAKRVDKYFSYIFGNASNDIVAKETWAKYLSGNIDVKGVYECMKNYGEQIIKGQK